MRKLIVTLIIGTLLALPLSAMAMDAITSDALDGVSGQTGVTVAFCGTMTTSISFDALSWGDDDGVGACANAGWLIIDGTITISQVIASGQTLELDVGTSGAGVCTQCAAVVIPAATTFIAVQLPTVTTTITVPDTLNIGLGTAAATIDGTLGILNLDNLTVSTGTPTALYIYAH